MLHVLHELEARHFTWHLLLLVVVVFVATPILKHALFRRGRGGSVWQPPRQERTQGQVNQARRFLAEQRRKKAEEAAAKDADD